MDIKTQNLITEHIVNDIKKYKVNTMDVIGLLEVFKLALYIKSTKEVQYHG